MKKKQLLALGLSTLMVVGETFRDAEVIRQKRKARIQVQKQKGMKKFPGK